MHGPLAFCTENLLTQRKIYSICRFFQKSQKRHILFINRGYTITRKTKSRRLLPQNDYKGDNTYEA